MSCKTVENEKARGICGTGLIDVIAELLRNGIIDETGCQRYTMTLEQLQALYKQFENFVADCPQQEYNENKSAIIAVYSLIHKHINNEIYK